MRAGVFTLKYGVILAVGISWAFVGAAAPVGPSLDSILDALETSEQRLAVARASFEVTHRESGELFWKGDWGWEHHKGYLKGTQFTSTPNEQRNSYQEIFAFDGETLRTYQPEDARKTGTIREYDPQMDVLPSPQILLGYCLSARDRLSLSEELRNADSVELISTDALVKGRRCCLISAVVHRPIVGVDRTVPRLVHVWLDIERDMRPLRIHHFRGTSDQLRKTVDNIKLAKFKGVWLPIYGETVLYELVSSSDEDSEGHKIKTPEEEVHVQEAAQTFVSKRALPKCISVSAWELPEDIPDDEFTVNFAPGSTVWDDFLQQTYKPGASIVNDLNSPRVSPISTQTVPTPQGDNRQRMNEGDDVEVGTRAKPQMAGETTLFWVGSVVFIAGSILAALGFWKRRRASAKR